MKRYFGLFALILTLSATGQGLVLDPAFGTNGTITTTDAITPINGYFENNQYYLFGTETRFARYNYDGSKDTAFGNYGFFVFSIAGEYPALKNFKIYNGKCYGFGKSESATTFNDGIVIRLTTNGQLDPTFGTNGVVRFNLGAKEYFNDIYINDDGSFFALGEKMTTDYDGRVLLCKFLENGTLDTSFNGTGSKVFPFSKRAKGISIFSYGNGLLLGNWTTGTNGNSVIYLQKIDNDGNLMPDFGTNGELQIPIPIFGSASDNNFINLKLAGNRIYAHFYTATSFSSQGYGLYIYDITNPATLLSSIVIYGDSYFKVLDSGKLLLTRGISCPYSYCYSTHYTINQYNADGTLDTTFDNDGIYQYDFSSTPSPAITEGATFCYQHDDGRIFIAGRTNVSNTALCMLRIGLPELVNADFDADASFSVYPNPSSRIIYINNKTNSIIENIFISDVSGKKIEAHIDSDNGVDIADLSKGIYFLSFTTNGNSNSLKFIKS